jgi:DNA-binding transcriptional LysR family regulator
MRRYIPSLLDLQAFEASARHLNFTRAGKELHLSQSAISHHVAKLEAMLSLRLFERTFPQLTLTDPGLNYINRIGPLLTQLEAATVEVLTHGDQGGSLNLACPTTFGVNWLIPRLPSFSQNNRNVSLTLVRYPKLLDHWPSDVDAAVRFGEPGGPGLVSHYLMGRERVVICHPDFLQGADRIRTPADLARFTLLQHEGEPGAWTSWFQAAGVVHPSSTMGPRFDPFSMLIKATAAKLGVALVPRCLLDPELKSQQVVVAFDLPFQSQQGYFLLFPQRRAGSQAIEALQHWLVDAAALQTDEWTVSKPLAPCPLLSTTRRKPSLVKAG